MLNRGVLDMNFQKNRALLEKPTRRLGETRPPNLVVRIFSEKIKNLSTQDPFLRSPRLELQCKNRFHELSI